MKWKYVKSFKMKINYEHRYIEHMKWFGNKSDVPICGVGELS